MDIPRKRGTIASPAAARRVLDESIKGPMAKSQFRRALQISLGDGLVLFKHLSSAICWR